MGALRIVSICVVAVACASPAATTPTRTPVAAAPQASQTDPDRDHDGIANECDACPDAPETFNGVCDEDGCPDVPVDSFPRGVITIQAVLLFDKESTKLSSLAGPLVEQVAASMLANKDVIEHVAVIGHASRDETDLDAKAIARATIVKRALVDRGVADVRLEVRGLGARRAFDENDASLNRRVEFVVVRAEGRDQFRFNGDAIEAIQSDEPERRNVCQPRPPTCSAAR